MTMFTLTEKMGVEINSDSPAGNKGEIGYQVIKYRLIQQAHAAAIILILLKISKHFKNGIELQVDRQYYFHIFLNRNFHSLFGLEAWM